MANNIIAIEEKPNLYPSSCSFNGDDSTTAEWFIRVVNPDLVYDTLLIGSVFFHEMAKRVGYVKLEEIDLAKQSLESQLADVTSSLDRLAAELSDLRTAVGSLEAVEQKLDGLRKVVIAAGKLVKSTEQSAASNASPSSDSSEKES